MGKFLYKCNFCLTEMEYEDGDQCCCICGEKFNFEIQNMQKEAQSLDKKIKMLSKENIKILNDCSRENIIRTILKCDKYRNVVQVIEKSKGDIDISRVNSYMQDKIDAIKQKRIDEGYTGAEILKLDSLYKYSWNKFCKRLYPTCDESKPVSPAHTYNAYICNHNKRYFAGADIFNSLNIKFKNNVFLKKDGKINILLFNDDNEKETIIFPSFDIKLYGIKSYDRLFKYEFSKKNVNREKSFYMVKQGAVVNDKGSHFELIEKGTIIFIDKSEYENMDAYYNDIIDNVKNSNLYNEFNYYDMLDEMYEKYKNK